MSVNYTEEQKNAINTDGCNILVSAAAGSGKTAVLVERIIRKITDLKKNINIDSLLVVTFTEAAAYEMKQRISDALINKLNSNNISRTLSEHISKQITLLNKAHISTIHSFCLDVVRKNFNQINIDPSFRIGDSTELNLIKLEIIDDVFEELYAEDNLNFIDFINCYAFNKSDDLLKDAIIDIYEFTQSMPNPLKWLKEKLKSYNPENIDDFFKKSLNIILDEKKATLLTIKDDLKSCISIIHNNNMSAVQFQESLDLKINYINKFIDALYSPIDKLKEFIEYKPDFPTLRLKKDDTLSKEYSKKIQDINSKKFTEKIKNLKIEISNIIDSILALDYDKMYKVVNCIYDIIEKFDKKFKSIKRDKMLVDFNDLEHYCIDILLDENNKPTNAAKKIQENFNEIIIDEYQDSSIIQELILSAVSKESLGIKNRFMVGDVKQCIYRFRLANPNIFIEKYNNYTPSHNSNKYRIDLSHNFRSRECVIHAVNFIFKQIMIKEFGNIEYDKQSELNYKADFPEYEDVEKISNDTELIIVDTNSKNINIENDFEYEEELLNLKSLEMEAHAVALRIKKLISDEKLNIYDKKIRGYRNAEYKDIVILMRSVKNTAETFSRILNENGVPTIYDAESGYFKSIEVMTIISYLKIIDNPRQDIPLISVLHSPIYNISSDELAKIRYLKKDVSFFDAITFYVSDENNENEQEISEKLLQFIYDLYDFQRYSKYNSINELLERIYNKTNYYNYTAVMSGGAVRQANLKSLQEKAINFEKTNFKGLFRFINYIDKIKTSSNDFGEAKVLAENENVVRIMTIHKSKGLEFPIVFVSTLNKKFSFQEARDDFVMDSEIGIGFRFSDFEKRIKFSTIQRDAIISRSKYESLTEEMRILYVALTRAKEKLILTGNVSNIEDFISSISKYMEYPSKTLPSHFLLKSHSLFEWIITALSRHKSFNLTFNIGYKDVYNKELFNDNSKWKIKVLNINNLSSEKKEEKEQKELLKYELNNINNENYIDHKDIYNRLSWTYPNIILNSLPSTLSISEIKRKRIELEFMDKENTDIIAPSLFFNEPQTVELKYPQFIQEEKPITSAQRGTAFHSVMEHIDFNKDYNINDIKYFVNNLSDKNIITKNEAKAVSAKKIQLFLNSDIVKRIKKSKRVYREFPFAMGLTPFEIYQKEEYKNINEKIIVHGIIDLYFYEGNEIILLDYKTGNTKNTNISAFKNKYRLQLDLYKKVIEKSTGDNVKEVMLYLFDSDEFINL